MPARAVDIAINVNIIISSLFFVCSVYCLTITQTIFATFIATNPPTRSPIPSANISFSSFCLFFSLLCLCPYQMWERSRYVPTVATAQIPSTAIAPIVFSSFIIDRYGWLNGENVYSQTSKSEACCSCYCSCYQCCDHCFVPPLFYCLYCLFLFVSLAVIT